MHTSSFQYISVHISVHQYIPENVNAHPAISLCSLNCNVITSYQCVSFTSVQVSAIIHQYEHTCVHISTHPDMSACSSNCNEKMTAGNHCSLNCKLQTAACKLWFEQNKQIPRMSHWPYPAPSRYHLCMVAELVFQPRITC